MTRGEAFAGGGTALPHGHGDVAPGAGADPVREVLDLFDRWGDGRYGEQVDQRSHARQCASWARADGAGDALVAAALLHDIGHLLSGPDPGPWSDPSTDDHHERLGSRWLAPRFGTDVARPVALHVLAKRYRCAVDPDYRGALSPTSTASLEAQGGSLGAAAAARFADRAGFVEAVALREWDERAKDPSAVPPGIETFVPLLRRLAGRGTTPPLPAGDLRSARLPRLRVRGERPHLDG